MKLKTTAIKVTTRHLKPTDTLAGRISVIEDGGGRAVHPFDYEADNAHLDAVIKTYPGAVSVRRIETYPTGDRYEVTLSKEALDSSAPHFSRR